MAGRVVALGSDVEVTHTEVAWTGDGQIEIGSRVVAFPWIGCGECEICAADREQLVIIGAGGVGFAGRRIAQTLCDAEIVVVEIDERTLEAATASWRSRISPSGAPTWEVSRRWRS